MLIACRIRVAFTELCLGQSEQSFDVMSRDPAMLLGKCSTGQPLTACSAGGNACGSLDFNGGLVLAETLLSRSGAQAALGL